MPEEKQPAIDAVSIAATEAARVVAQAVENAKKMVDRATKAAAEIVQKDHIQETKITRIVSEALRETFDIGEKTQRFVDVSKIPLICASIVNIHSNIEAIKDTLQKTDGDHETRIRSIENTIWKWIGISIAVSVIAGPVMTILIAWVISILVKK